MTIVLNGTTGITSVNGSAAAPSVTGTDTDTGIVYGTNTLSLATGGTTAVTVDSSQNVGFGTASPSTYGKLAVVGNVAAPVVVGIDNASSSTSAGTKLQFSYQGAETGYILNQFDGGSFNTTFSANKDLIFRANGAERARIDYAGNLLVGTTTLSGKLNISQASAQGGTGAIGFFKNEFSGDSSYFGLYVAKFANDTTTAQRYIGFSYNNNQGGGGQINANGAGAAAFGSFSDIRLKENVVDLPNQLQSILALRPVEFDYKTGGHQIGFIAQEMQEVYPDAVSKDGSEDNYLTLTGWSKTEARLVKAIQEQQAIIEQLRADVEALKAA